MMLTEESPGRQRPMIIIDLDLHKGSAVATLDLAWSLGGLVLPEPMLTAADKFPEIRHGEASPTAGSRRGRRRHAGRWCASGSRGRRPARRG